MPKQPDLKKIGAFMLAGCAVLLMILGGLLQNKIFNSRGKEIVMYFEESINGLGIGSPVVFKGVKIGADLNLCQKREHGQYKSRNCQRLHQKSKALEAFDADCREKDERRGENGGDDEERKQIDQDLQGGKRA